MTIETRDDVCTACGKPLEKGKYVILGNGVKLCINCATVAKRGVSAIKDCSSLPTGDKEQKNTEMNDGLHPTQVKAYLDRFVVGQDKAKKILAVAVYNHYKRLALNDPSIQKSNVLMVGPTGSGKTYIVQTLAKALNVPLAIADATTLTEAGYIGDDVETVLAKLVREADGDIERAQNGIVFIDEVDKLSSTNSDTEKKVGGKGVQQALLKLLEGASIEVSVGDKDATASAPTKVTIDTSNILFICGGAFPDVEQIISRRLSQKGSIGFGSVVRSNDDSELKKNILLNVTTDDLRKFGMIPEFLGRLPIIAPLEELTIETLKKILTEPENALFKQYQKLMAYDEVKLSIQEDALELIAQKAIERKTGARSLRAIMEDVLLEVMYGVPDNSAIGEVTITKDCVEHKGEPMISMRNVAIAANSR